MITAFLPCRKGSQRIPDKNVKAFAGIKGGLLDIKLRQLASTKEVDQILVSSNDERVLQYASDFNASNIIIDERPDHLGSSDTTTDELICYVPTIIKEGDVLWTHVTSPFVTNNDYDEIIEKYYLMQEQGFDSLMTVHPVYGFLWKNNSALNYDRTVEKWPRTQTLEPILEVDSAAFLSPLNSYSLNKDRIGIKPYLYEQEKMKSLDIDWPDDFDVAEAIWNAKFNQ